MTGGRRFDLLVAGELNPDIIVAGPNVTPVFGQAETVVDAIRLEIGSSSAIVACGAARLGLRTAFVGVVGDDAFGRFMLGALGERGIDTAACRVDPSVPTGATAVLSRGSDRAILTAIGAIDRLRVADIPAELVADSHHLHVGSTYLQPDLAAELPDLFATAWAAGTTSSFDCNWDPSERWNGGIDALLRAVDVFLPNLEEALRITGMATSSAAAAELVRRASGDRKPDRPFTLAVKHGAAGAVAVGGTGGHESAQAAGLPVMVVDSTGAGDSFDAGFLHGYIEGRSLQAALDLAVACGSLSVTGIGGTAAQPTLEAARAALAAAGR